MTALDRAKEVFSDQLHQYSDALFFDAKRDRVFAFTGLRYHAPVCTHLINDPQIYTYLKDIDGDILFNEDLDLYYNGRFHSIDGPLKERFQVILDRIYSSPGTLNDKGELCIDLKSYHIGSHYGVNLLLGERSEYADCLQSTPKSVLDEFGRGSFRGKQEKQVLATRYVLSPDENGEPANRQFYITENGKQIFYSLDVRHNVKEAYCLHSQNRTIITYETKDGLKIVRTIFLLPQEEGMPTAVEAQRIEIFNLKETPRDLRIIVTGMFGITDPGTLAGDIVYANVVVESELYYHQGRPVAMTAHHQPKACDSEKRFAMLLQDGYPFDEYCSSLYDFIGSGTLEEPEMISRLNNAHSRRQAAFFAMARSFELKDKTTIDCFVGMDDKEPDVRKQFDEDLHHLYEKYSDPKNLHETYEKMIEENERYFSFIQASGNDSLADSYLNGNLPFQVLYQTFVSRSFAWTQKSYRETGFREIQDIFASMYYMHAAGKDELIRRLLRSWAENVFTFGYAYHNFTSRGKEAGMCSDDQLWLIQAIYRYVTLTDDLDFLKEEMKIAGSDKTRPLYETLKAIITYSGKISIGKHGLPLLDTADWNDCLRLDKEVLWGPQKEEAYFRQLKEKGQDFGVAFENEQSESVMNACLLKIAADEVCEMAEKLGLEELICLSREISEKVHASVYENAWKKDYYARCLINDDRGYTYLGSTGDGLSLDENIDGTYYLNGFSWPLLADIADERQIRMMLDIIERYLKTDAGLKLVTPVDYDKLGITTGSSFYFPGDRENGGVFKHAAMMCTVACLKKAKTVKDEDLSKRLKDLAFFMISKTLPYKTLEDPYVLKGNPRFCTQYNNSETGEGIGPILSGTASWLTLAYYEILGIRISGDIFCIDPIIDSDRYHYALNLADTCIDVTIRKENGHRVDPSSRFIFDGRESDQKIRLPHDKMKHQLEVIL
jgi:cellobiose phosphorylase